jgi:SET domain-containing protein
MIPDLILEAYNDVYCKLAPSNIEGIGVFAIRDIPENTIIFRNTSEFVEVSKKFLGRINPNVAQLYKNFFVSDEDNIWIPKHGINMLDISFYLNHSASPNTVWDLENELFISKVLIREGEELTFNYKVFGAPIDF